MSHRIFRRLAERLSTSGYHVLRFDYYGTGDAAGQREEGDLATWLEDAATATEELRELSGFDTVATFGVRLGAAVAWRLATSRADVHTVVLWDPVVYGSAYMTELHQAQFEIDRRLLTPITRDRTPGGSQDLLGFPMTTGMRASIVAITPQLFELPTRAQVKLFYSDTSPQQSELQNALHAAGTPYHAETVRGQTPWREDEAVGARGMPVLVLERMVEILR